jgi:hypothetical protein
MRLDFIGVASGFGGCFSLENRQEHFREIKSGRDKMNVLTVIFKNTPSPAFLYFKDWKDAAKARDVVLSGDGVTDDFSTSIRVVPDTVAAIVVSDLDRQIEARAEVTKKEMAAQRKLNGQVMPMGGVMPPRMV